MQKLTAMLDNFEENRQKLSDYMQQRNFPPTVVRALLKKYAANPQNLQLAEFMREYLQTHPLSDYLECFLVREPSAAKLLPIYIDKWTLSVKAETELFANKRLRKVALRYMEKYELYDAAIMEIFKYPDASVWVEMLIRRFPLENSLELQMMELPNIGPVVRLYHELYGFFGYNLQVAQHKALL